MKTFQTQKKEVYNYESDIDSDNDSYDEMDLNDCSFVRSRKGGLFHGVFLRSKKKKSFRKSKKNSTARGSHKRIQRQRNYARWLKRMSHMTHGGMMSLSEKHEEPHLNSNVESNNESKSHNRNSNHWGLNEVALGLDMDEDIRNRLMEILEGDEITPDDYDILLLLDQNNSKSIHTDESLDNLPIQFLGNQGSNGLERSKIPNSKCEICLESWEDLENGTQVRQLECGHVYCKDCIDVWFKEVSTTCPYLSCYWKS